jgi:hypothetical protein
MKKIVASVGLVALGASGLQTALAQELSGPDTSKPWSVSLTLRGFYDSNPGTVPNSENISDKESFGVEVSPSAAFAWAMQDTTINLGFLYSLKYYDTKPPNFANHADQSFTFNGSLTHAFSEQLHARVSDSFVIGQEPDTLRAGNTFSTFQRVSGDNIRNYGTLGLDAQITPVFGLGFGYDNAFYDYTQSGASAAPPIIVSTPVGLALATPVVPSPAGALNRDENRAHLEGLFSVGPETKVLGGFQYTEILFMGGEPISGYYEFPDTLAMSDSRNSREYTIYVGAEHNFSPKLTGSLRVGGSYTEYYNDPSTDPSYTPYVNATIKYNYATESYVSGGFSYDRNATDVVGLYNNGKFTIDAESAVFFLALNHRFDPRIFGNLIAQFQNSTYNQGQFNNQSEQYYLVGLELEYKFNQYFSAHVGYNYDRLESDIGRTYDRNRVYIGVTGSY